MSLICTCKRTKTEIEYKSGIKTKGIEKNAPVCRRICMVICRINAYYKRFISFRKYQKLILDKNIFGNMQRLFILPAPLLENLGRTYQTDHQFEK